MHRKYFSSILISVLLLLVMWSVACGDNKVAHDVAFVADTESQHMYLLDKAGE